MTHIPLFDPYYIKSSIICYMTDGSQITCLPQSILNLINTFKKRKYHHTHYRDMDQLLQRLYIYKIIDDHEYYHTICARNIFTFDYHHHPINKYQIAKFLKLFKLAKKYNFVIIILVKFDEQFKKKIPFDYIFFDKSFSVTKINKIYLPKNKKIMDNLITTQQNIYCDGLSHIVLDKSYHMLGYITEQCYTTYQQYLMQTDHNMFVEFEMIKLIKNDSSLFHDKTSTLYLKISEIIEKICLVKMCFNKMKYINNDVGNVLIRYLGIVEKDKLISDLYTKTIC